MKSARTIAPLPFRWSDFVFGNPGRCFPACVLMCCKYWMHYEPNLNVPLDLDDLERKLGDVFYSSVGLSLDRLIKHLKKTEIREMEGERIDMGLTIEAHCPKKLNDLYVFFIEDPPIPLILVFDKSYTERNQRGDIHAVILSSLDYEKEKIYVIDPVKKDLKSPYPYDFNRFNLGWGKIDNLILMVAPIGRLNLRGGEKVSIFKQVKLDEV